MYTWVDHTSELQLEIAAGSERGVFEEAIEALRELLEEAGPEGAAPSERESPRSGGGEVRRIAVIGRDRAALLAELLGELVYAAESDDFVPVALKQLALSDERLAAEIDGYHGRPRQLVKAVTYHRLRLERFSGGWRASLVLDV